MSSIEHKKGNTNPLLQRLAQAKQGKPVTIGPKPFSSKVDQTIRINRAVSSLNQTVTGSKPNIVHQKPNVCKTINKINNSQLSAGFKHKATFKAPVGTNYAPGWKPNSRIIALHCIAIFTTSFLFQFLPDMPQIFDPSLKIWQHSPRKMPRRNWKKKGKEERPKI